VTQLHLLDGTYELFRSHFGRPAATDPQGRAIAATTGVVESTLALFRQGVTHLAVATDHVIRSWRNDRWPGYKTDAGMPAELLAQFPRVEEALRAIGVVVWPQIEFEADDALGAAASRWGDAPEIERVVIMSPDKDMAQCVRPDGRVVGFDRRKGTVIDAEAVRAKFGVEPESIPDYLALVGDSADGYPGLPGWGAKSAAAVLLRYRHIDDIPERASAWDVSVRNAPQLAASLREQRELALLFRELATLRDDAPVPGQLADLEWRGVPRPAFEQFVEETGARSLFGRVPRWAA
jgi:5'-3' exonuclease